MRHKNYNSLKKALTASGIKDEVLVALDPSLKNLATMANKLEDLRKIIEAEPAVIEYDNGGGQSGMRENPSYKAYEALWKSYLSGMTILIKMLDTNSAKPDEKQESATALQLILNKHKKTA